MGKPYPLMWKPTHQKPHIRLSESHIQLSENLIQPITDTENYFKKF